MYVQVVSYGLEGISERDYLDIANDVAPRFAAMPGLLAKVWLGNSDVGRYGALYLWEDERSMERFMRSDLFELANPDFGDVIIQDFDILENLTAATQPVVELVEGRRQSTAPVPRPAPRAPTPRAPRSRAPTARASAPRRVPVTSKSAGTRTAAATSPRAGSTKKKAPSAPAQAARRGPTTAASRTAKAAPRTTKATKAPTTATKATRATKASRGTKATKRTR